MTVGTNKSRKDMRAVVSLVARYRSPTTFEYASEFCSDVSVGGMFIKSAAPAPTGTLLKLECESDISKEAQIRGVARVVWLRAETNEHGPAGMGVKFVKLEAGSRELIEGIVQRLAEAGVQARSMSAAPENVAAAAAAGGGVAATASQPAPQTLRLVHSSAPPAADGGESAAAPESSAQYAAGAVSETETEQAAPQPAAASVEQAATFQPAIEERPSLGATGSSRPPPPAPSRFGWKGWAIGIALVLAAIAIADRRSAGTKETPVTPEPPPVAAPAQPQAEPAAPPVQPKAAVEPAPAPAPPPPAEPAAAQPAEPPAQPSTPEPSAEAPAASTEGPLYPLVAGRPAYVIEFVSRPNEATVSIDEKLTLVTPKEVNMGGMPARVKITAKKDGYLSSSIWLARDGFENKGGALRKRVYLTLKSETEK